MPRKNFERYNPELIAGLLPALDALHKALEDEYKKFGVANPRTLYMPQLDGFKQPTHSLWRTNTKVENGSKPLTVARHMRASLQRSLTPPTATSSEYVEAPDEQRLAEIWARAPVKRARRALVTHLNEYIARVGALDATESIEQVEIHELPYLLVEDQHKGWNRVQSAFFAMPADESGIPNDAVNYLKGGDAGPLWPRTNVAIRRSDYIGLILDSMECAPVALVHAPVGEGKSTIVSQISKIIVDRDRPVFWISDVRVLDDPHFVGEIQWQRDRPLIVLDDVLLETKLPTWAAWPPGFQGGNFLIAHHTRHYDQQSRLMGTVANRTVPIAEISDAEIKAIIECLHKYGAVPHGQSIAKTQELVARSLKFNRSLWPAQYAATRGYLLLDRVRRLVEEIAREHDGLAKLHALAAVAVASQGLTNSGKSKKRFNASPRRGLMHRVVKAFDELDAGFIATVCGYINNLSGFIEGELLDRNYHIYADPEVHFRHPEVARTIGRVLFFPHRGQRARFNRWDFVEPLCLALPQDQFRASDTLLLLDRAIDRWHRGSADRGAHDLHALVERCVVGLTHDDFHVQARLELARARAILLDTTKTHDDATIKFSADRINVALQIFGNSVPYSVDISVATMLAHADLEIETKIGGKWVWENWRFFATRGEQKCAAGRAGPNPANGQIFRLLVDIPGLADEGELIEYAGKNDLTSQFNWQVFADALVVCESLLVENEDGGLVVAIPYDFPPEVESKSSFHSIVLHLWTILAKKQDDICDEMEGASESRSGRTEDAISQFVRLMEISVSSATAAWTPATVSFFGANTKIDKAWVRQASELLGAEILLRDLAQK